MPLDLSTRTLYDDWLARRERLLAQPITPGDSRATELRLIEYLLGRYKDTPQAARPARPPLAKNLYVDDRAIIVHHYLGGGLLPTIRNAREAHAHVRTLVERMTEAKAGEATFAGGFAAGPRFRDPNPILEAVRGGLCHQDPAQRVLAAVQLGAVGTLEDVSLLSDLLALPEQPDEHRLERAALLHAMRRISGETTERFDLTELYAPPAPPWPEPPELPPAAPDALADQPVPDEPAPPPANQAVGECGYWKCTHCGAEVIEFLDDCWTCGKVRGEEGLQRD